MADTLTNNAFKLSRHSGKVTGSVRPPASKSESNRALIIHALTGMKCDLQNLSNARDTQTMIRLLNSSDYVLDVLDAGTTMRFLTAFCAVSGRKAELTGTSRMRERPIKLLVDALKELGCAVQYKEKEGFPPLLVDAFDRNTVTNNRIRMKGDVSSQYITAMLLVAPTLPQGLQLELEGKVGSKPYIEMTLSLMKHFGVKATTDWEKQCITIPHQSYSISRYEVESDWSAASYWFSIAALSEHASIEILGYKSDSLQGDRTITEMAPLFGVKPTFTDKGLLLEKCAASTSFHWDFTPCPDLAQTIAVICAAKGIECTMSGLESLRIKETDRIAALQIELKKFGADMVELEKDTTYRVVPGSFNVNNQFVHTYKDHRMAMAFAPLALLGELRIEAPEVVEKSYPHYWEDLKKVGFEWNEISL
ncbi:MAG: 3-phosphoshikimate 1-carboxyvinyltransferase [Cytophagaceae bacterium]|nr:3-phosphoshikimate 1-carboxyvinyltransferase [Cytophagaceae bacterium]